MGKDRKLQQGEILKASSNPNFCFVPELLQVLYPVELRAEERQAERAGPAVPQEQELLVLGLPFLLQQTGAGALENVSCPCSSSGAQP